ncbi:hypothetical protein NSA11_05180 [Lactobacillus taiwanensis]|uniref:hypothetical protein n=1 Tax=Lactobacillus taiwanensis TaxID=508451 RepID=UPI00214CE7AB|nr:hypothetical protein [Lactobacillus taiwanensis]MCR1903326.1 hypothetical protein [Lactobacillus taiwanensis]
MKKINKYMLSAGILFAVGTNMLISPSVYADSITSTAHESIYHLTTKDGWSNDLQSMETIPPH